MPTRNTSRSRAIQTGRAHSQQMQSHREEQEFGLAKKEYIVCPECQSAYFDKSWHHLLHDEKQAHLQKEGKKIVYKLCPADHMKKNREFEGELVVKLKTINYKLKTDILNTIHNSDAQAREKDPMDRILWTEDNGEEIKFFLSENQLAVRIGKKLHSSFPQSKLEINHGKGEDVIRVFWEY